MKLSIVMTSFNRKPQTLATLESIAQTQFNYSNFDVWVIDDASDPEHKIDQSEIKMGFPVHVVRVEPEQKTWQEPLALINQVIRNCKSDIIILQNAECYHVNDVISHTMRNISRGQYLSFGCYSLTEEETYTHSLGAAFPATDNNEAWFNHSVHRPVAFHFCSAVYRDDYLNIGGLNESFSDGICYSDTELAYRVKKNLNVIFVDDPFVFHQWHPVFTYYRENSPFLMERNRAIYEQLTGYLTQWIPKRIYTMWLSNYPPPEQLQNIIETHNIEGYEHELITLENCDRSSYYVQECLSRNDVIGWVKAVDYLRILYVYLNGGIYLDADVEVLEGKNFDKMLYNRLFVGQEENGHCSNAVVGAEKMHPALGIYLSRVEQNYRGTGDLVFDPGIRAFTDVLYLSNREQLGIKIYSSDYFYPNVGIQRGTEIGPFAEPDPLGFRVINENTITYHHFTKLWTPTPSL